ncbi:luciferase family oxidoreductase group 1 [Curtobacterium sp. PhB42]|uniref:LLM class flavin-dependent oxidoreductase n=1 Tax=unclassified Curtobacterium TaxID=257496 RepID=UPI001063E9A7|nr:MULTISPECIES: LLM class flavin-dependent oxidoreductase [unclassified Curtobacterium]TDW44217.1 luciferase family oxidoreductase group 1 [Curtobacterium sp. PhB42]TDW53312.1 luciferase family oxidoreductase group 1 [Curtobacterium sp. PhB190]
MSDDTLHLSVLDLATREYGQSNTEALQGSIDMAVHAEKLGYERFWVAEHHGMPGITSSAPAVLLSAVGAATSTIRIGSGGVMLPNHAPLVIAEQFGTLRALYGDRVDLGLGRAPGTDGATAMALRRTDRLDVDDFPDRLADLIGFFTGMDKSNPLSRIRAVPGYGDVPEFWLLGSSGYSAQVAGALGVSFAFAHHFASDNTEAALALYRDSFRPSRFRQTPNALIGVQVVTDEDPAVVDEQSAPGMISFIRMRSGRKPEPVSMDEARAYEFTDLERRFIAARTERQAYGTADQVADKINALVASTGANGVIVAPGAAQARYRHQALDVVAGLHAAGRLVRAGASASASV